MQLPVQFFGFKVVSFSFLALLGLTVAAGTALAAPEVVKTPTSVPAPVLTKKILRQTMPDGSVTFTDVPDRGAVKTIETRYQTTSTPEAMRIASANQEYWRKQEAAFERRQEKRDSDNERAARERQRAQANYAYQTYQAHSQDSYWNGPRIVYGVRGAPQSAGPLPPAITSGVGAAHSQPSSFIGSGFATSSPFRR